MALTKSRSDVTVYGIHVTDLVCVKENIDENTDR